MTWQNLTEYFQMEHLINSLEEINDASKDPKTRRKAAYETYLMSESTSVYQICLVSDIKVQKRDNLNIKIS